ncbi:hypothetical protein NL676_034298 [Syzygium grande]|nr:hypothetical protein NL676_034298 [Syzygium grande]
MAKFTWIDYAMDYHNHILLGELRVLDLRFNGLSDKIPVLPWDSIAQTMDFSSNAFRGVIPPSIFQLGWNLTNFNASNNHLAGAIPSPICDATNPHRSFDLSGDDKSSEIPTGRELLGPGGLPRRGFNLLAGEVPDDLYAAMSLEELSLHVNPWTGEGAAEDKERVTGEGASGGG